MSKKQLTIIIVLLSVVVLLLLATGGVTYGLLIYEPSESKIVETSVTEDASGEWNFDSLKKGKVTAIDAQTQYSAYIGSLQEAEEELKAFGEEQRAKYDNPRVEKIEKRIEKKYGIYAVNLGEMDKKTAKDVEKAVKYMYKRYPSLKGTLTNITLANLDTFTSGHIALTQTREYIINEQFGATPFVVKHEILLSASSFMDREALLNKCAYGVETDYWPEGMDISTLVVHELAHQVLNSYIMKYYEFENVYYVTEENKEAFSEYLMDGLAANQTVAKMVVESAYNNWLVENPGRSYEDFCKSISGYAQGLQEDGGFSYTETVAEALADIYLNGKKASSASHAIEDVLMKE